MIFILTLLNIINLFVAAELFMQQKYIHIFVLALFTLWNCVNIEMLKQKEGEEEQ